MVLGSYGHGGDIYRNRVVWDFSANINPLGTPQAVREAVRQSAESLSPYPDPYCSALRAGLSAALGTPEETILCGNGAAELIFQFALALRPQRALVPVPSFSEYTAALEAAGCEIEPYPLLREQELRLTEAVLERITPETGALFLCNPNNPTGQLVDRELLLAILKRCRETGTWLFLDECFFSLTDPEAAFSLLPCLEPGDPAVILRAFTKLYGLAGLRLGFCVSRDPDILERMCRLQQPWNVSSPAQAAGLAALDCRDFARESLETIARERRFLERGLERLKIPYLPSRVNFMMLQGEPHWGKALLDRGILIRSCANYPGLTDRDYRIAVRTREANEALLTALAALTEGRL